MEFRRSKRIKIEEPSSEYPHPLQLYLKPPTGEISLEEFESVAYDRLKLLRILEQATLMGHKIYSTEWKIAVIGYLKKDGLRKYMNLIQSSGSSVDSDADVATRREDHISHFILRLCYCRSLELRTWFIARENELFKLRFSNLTSEGLRNFIRAYRLSYAPISEETKDGIKEELLTSTYGYNVTDVETRDFYRVPFFEVCDLVSRRMVYLKEGYAYIPSAELVSCLVSTFRSNLNEELTQAGKILPFIDDERIIGLLQSLHGTYTGKDYAVGKKGKIDLEDLDALSEKSFPLCMRHLFDVIKQTHHMKHFGRLQFGLFLKGIGLTLEDAITYWRSEFTKLMDEDKFNKGYLYSIKHSYGCLGKMVNYTPYSCAKIISLNVGPGECHGCPFKHWESESLWKKMADTGIVTDGIKDVLETARNGHYQIACTKYFTHAHAGIEPKVLLNHPNQYFEESREIRTNSREKFDNRNVNKRNNQNGAPRGAGNATVEDDKSCEQYLDSNMDWNTEVEEGSLALSNEIDKTNE